MKKHIILPIIVFLAFSTLVFSDEEHTEIVLMDKNGSEILEPGALISANVTCGECHEAEEINSRMVHIKNGVKADCISCHFKEGKMEGDYSQAHLRIQRPTTQNCLFCHGIGSTGKDPLTIPADYLVNLGYKPGKKYYGITQHTGVILSPQHIADSALNIKNKGQLNVAWDVHARLRMDCIYCHHNDGKGAYSVKLKSPPEHLTKGAPEADDLQQNSAEPNHDLNKASCTSCHNPATAHINLPYREKHLERMSCQSCHVSDIYGPAFKAVDNTVIHTDGTVRVELQSVDETASHGTSLNTKFYRGYVPFLFLHKDDNGKSRFSPFNLVTRWNWNSGKTGEPVPQEVLKKAFLDPSEARYADDVIKSFDKNGDKQIDETELVLDSKEKTNLIRNRLSAQGIEEPVIVGTVMAHQVKHGMIRLSKMQWSCNNCHGNQSRFGGEVVLAVTAPGGGIPVPAKSVLSLLKGEIFTAENGEVILKRKAAFSDHYIFGFSGIHWLNGLGVWIFLLVVITVFFHGGLGFIRALKHTTAGVKTRSVFRYGVLDQLWHWVLAAVTVLTALAGLQIHYAGRINLFGLHHAISLHNILAIILAVNAGLGLVFHLVTGKIGKFFTVNSELFNKTPNRGQKRTYIILLNILLPVLALSGALIWLVPHYRTFLGPIHSFAAWLFLALLVIHIYLATTGMTPFDNFRAMFTGWGTAPEGTVDEAPVTLRDLRILDFAGTVIGKFTREDYPEKGGKKNE